MIGKLFVAEYILVLALPLLLIDRGRMLLDSMPKAVLTLGLCWLASQILTDIVNATPFQDYSRGWAKIVIFLINFSAIYMLIYGNRRRIVLFAVGLAVGVVVLQTALSERVYGSRPVEVRLRGAGLHRRRGCRPIPHLARRAVVPGSGHGRHRRAEHVSRLPLGRRFVLPGRYLSGRTADLRSGRRKLTQPNNTKLVLMIALGVGAIWAVLAAYQFAALEGYLGEDARDKLIDQTNLGAGILLGGRTEILVSMQAIADSPILGHGSWAKGQEYVDLLFSLTRGAEEKSGRAGSAT